MTQSNSEKKSGIDSALAILRNELEAMQQQDKALYQQLLLLQDNIKVFKVELKREREECVEAMRDLHDISSDNDSVENTTQQRENINTKPEKSENIMRKHERQDSGISVRHSGEIVSPVDITGTNSKGMSVKPNLIHHKKQDSGILIDDEALNDTKLLSRLVVESSSQRMLAKRPDNPKIEAPSSPQQVAVDYNNNHFSNNNNDYPNQTKIKHLVKNSNRDFVNNPRPYLPVNHSRTRSCPATSVKLLNGYNYSAAVTMHQVRPTKRSASVVDLSRLTEEENCEAALPQNDRSVKHELPKTERVKARIAAKSEPHLFVREDKPLRAVFISAGGFNEPDRPFKSVGYLNATAQRRFTAVAGKPAKQFYDNKYAGQVSGGRVVRNTISPSPSLQSLRNHNRHRTLPDNATTKRRHSMMNIWHASSKSWDGSASGTSRPRPIPNLYRSASQISLV